MKQKTSKNRILADDPLGLDSIDFGIDDPIGLDTLEVNSNWLGLEEDED